MLLPKKAQRKLLIEPVMMGTVALVAAAKGRSLDGKDNTSSKEDTKTIEPFVPPSSLPLPTETPTKSKYVIINFDDSHQSDYTYAKPILDKYGFKATFFEVCTIKE